MNTSREPAQLTIAAIHVTTEEQRLAFQVVDLLDELESHLGAYRAVQQLAVNERHGSDPNLPQLQRADLSQLMHVLNADLAQRCAIARAAAVFCATRRPT